MNRFRILLKVLAVTLALAAPLYAYVTSKGLSSTNSIVQIKWANGAFPIRWQMNPAAGSNITGSRQQSDVVRESFQAWSAIPTATITFAEGPATAASVKPAYDGMNVITTNLTSSDWSALGVGSGVLAFTIFSWADRGGPGVVDSLGRAVSFAGQMTEADIAFNPAYEFSTEATVPSDKVDFQSVVTHEIGHFLGLDHSPIVASTMYWILDEGLSTPRTLWTDDIAGVSSIYPSASFSLKATLSGTVRTTANVAVYGAVVVAVNSTGQPVASAVTDPSGRYSISGLESGTYTVYAEPLDGPTGSANVSTLSEIFAGQTVNTNFTTRFR
ncbi:MAG: hypothetical protein DMG13_13110 [Acidobacteria bacterium]|nr:MAG: hypothetical protein DMG13_13110 [Acidobacteriota bacterium]